MLDAHDPVGDECVGREPREQFEYPWQIRAQAVVVELPCRKPCLVSHGTDELATGPKTVDRLGRTESEQRLNVRRPHRAFDEVLYQGGAALIVQLAGSDALERSLWACRRRKKSI